MITVGEMAPEFTLEGSNGEEVRLADFAVKCSSLFLSERYDARMYN